MTITTTPTVLTPIEVGCPPHRVGLATIVGAPDVPDGQYLVTPRHYYPNEWVLLHAIEEQGWTLDDDVHTIVRTRYAFLRGSYLAVGAVREVVVLPDHPQHAEDRWYTVRGDGVEIAVHASDDKVHWVDDAGQEVEDLPVIGLAEPPEVVSDAEATIRDLREQLAESRRLCGIAEEGRRVAQSALQASQTQHREVRRALIDEGIEREWCNELNDFLDNVGYERWEVEYEVAITYKTTITMSGCEHSEAEARSRAVDLMQEADSSYFEVNVDLVSDNR